MSQHTPGPWGWVYDGSSTYSIGEDDDPQGTMIASVADRRSERAMANCSLIAAAPELLAALKGLLAFEEYAAYCQECGIGRSAEWQAAKAAVAKAEGRG